MTGKRLEMTEEILDRVVYGMENQKERLFLDPADGMLKSADGGSPPAGAVPMPPWGSAEGFRLMDAFAGTLTDEFFRSRLQDILRSGTGVFRRFKDALKERPEMEGLWFRFKKREMRKTALSWLSRWSEALALEALGPEPEEWEDLALTDFGFRPGRRGDSERIAVWDADAENEALPSLSGEDRARFSLRVDVEIPSPEDLIIAEGPSGEIVGFSWFSVSSEGPAAEGRLLQVYVRAGYRGLGIGRRLVEMALDAAASRGARSFAVRSGNERSLDGFLESLEFERIVVLWRKDM